MSVVGVTPVVVSDDADGIVWFTAEGRSMSMTMCCYHVRL